MLTDPNVLFDKANALSAQAEALSSDVLTLRQAAIDLQEQEARLAELQARVSNLQASLTTAETDLSAERVQHAAARQALAEAQQQVLLQMAEVERLRAEVAQREAQIVLLEAEVAHLKAQLNPTPPVPTYRLTASVAEMDEGATVVCTLHTTGVPEGAMLPYELAGVSASDVVGGELTGFFFVGSGGTGAVSITTVRDATTEGAEALTVRLLRGLAEVSVQVLDTSIDPPTAPVDPVPLPAGLRYRDQHPYLFSTVAQAFEPSRVAGGAPLRLEGIGPTGTLVGANAGAWKHRGGDWIDVDGVSQGTKPWLSTPTNAVKSGSADYTADCTAIVRESQKPGRYLAMRLQTSGGAQRRLSGVFGAKPPSITVVYDDGSTATLTCRITAAVVNTNIPETTLAEVSLPVFAEFTRPDKPVTSASLQFTISQHYDGSTSLIAYLLDPPRNTNPVQLGIAAFAPLDAGLVGRADVIHVHRYLDGTTLKDFVYSDPVPGPAGYNFSAEHAYDPAIYETGAQDLTRFPHIGQGKWVGAPVNEAAIDKNGLRVPALWRLVDSTYRAEGFEPLAPGMGAIRMLMRKGVDLATGEPIADGAFVGYGGTNGGAARLFMPEPRFGRQKRVFVRQYVRIGTMDGGPIGEAAVYQVYKDKPAPGINPVWTVNAGKCWAAPTHDTTYGGFSGTAGGNYGNNFRLGWGTHYQVSGPDAGSWHCGSHAAADYQNAQPDGYNYGNTPPQDQTFGQIGGRGGVLYPHLWYCLETEVDLNSVSDTYPGFKPDGVYRQWLDGVLVYERTGMVWRANPPYNGWRTLIALPLVQAGDQFAAAKIGGTTAGKGYAGVTVRHTGAVNAPNYTAFVSRTDIPGRVVVALVKRTTHRLGEQLAVTAALAWTDGDELRLDAVGTAPTVLTVRRNDEVLLAHSDAADSAHRGPRMGVFGTSNGPDGLWITHWRGGAPGGAPGGAETAHDFSAYADGTINRVAPDKWLQADPIGTGTVAGGRLLFPVGGDALTINRQLACRPIRELGHREVLFNWFNGGLTQNTEDRVIFLTGLVVSDSYVGPMRLP